MNDASPDDLRALGRDRAALVTPALIEASTKLIYSADDPDTIPDATFRAMLFEAFAFVEQTVPLLRGIGCTNQHVRFFREGARAHVKRELELAKAAALADGAPN